MLITNFASGELSQNLNGRVDIQQYYQGAAAIKNFDIIPTGGIKRRPGTKRVAELGDNNRIIPFIVDKNLVFILEIGLNPDFDPLDDESEPGMINVWQRQPSGVYETVYTVYTPWESLAEIKQLHYAQNYDTIVFVHKNYRPYIMKLTGTTFTASVMEFDFTADVELDDDFDFVMVDAGADLPVGTYADGHWSFTYKRMINGVPTEGTWPKGEGINEFWTIWKGKLYKSQIAAGVCNWIQYGTDSEIDTELFTTANKMPACVAFFNNRLFFASTANKPQMVWASAAPDSYDTRYNDFATYKKYVTVNKVVKDADLHLFTCDIAQTDIDTTNHRTTLTNVTQNFTMDGKLKTSIDKYFVSSGVLPVGTKIVSVTNNTITVDTDKVNVVFSESHTVELNLVMSIQLWRDAETASAEDYEYMVVANNITTADCSLFFELASDQNDAIKFLSSNKFLAVGTESSIWSIDPGISALNINAQMQGRYGSDDLQGQAVETATVYFAQGLKGIREFYYDGESKAFRTNNIALLADHILRESRAIDFDYMTNPYSRLLIVRENGSLAVMLYDKTNGIMAWSRCILGKGLIKNCAVTRGTDENDLVFFVVEDGGRYFLEVLDLGSSIYLDSWKEYDPTEEEPADGYTAGAVLYNVTKNITCPYDNIPAGFYDIDDEILIGYLFESYIKSMPVVAGELSKRQRISSLYVRFLNSYLPVVKCTGLPDEKFTTITERPYSGVGKVNYPGTTDRDVCFELKAGEIDPVNILSVEAQLA
jgi:hypothetical protein